MKSLSLCLSAALVILSSCSTNEHGVQPTTIDNSAIYRTVVHGADFFTPEEQHQYFDQPNSIGLIRLWRIEHDVCGWNGSGSNLRYGPFEYDDSHHTDAVFWNNGNRVTIGEQFELNAKSIKQDADGKSYSGLGGSQVAEITFGGAVNMFQFYTNSQFNQFKDSLSFSSPIHITNIQRLDTIHSNQDVVVNWNGGSGTGKMLVSILTSRLEDTYTPKGETTGINFFVSPTSNNTLTIPHQLLQQLSTTYAIGSFFDIHLKTAEPKTITTPNGKSISILGVSEHVVTVVLKQ